MNRKNIFTAFALLLSVVCAHSAAAQEVAQARSWSVCRTAYGLTLTVPTDNGDTWNAVRTSSQDLSARLRTNAGTEVHTPCIIENVTRGVQVEVRATVFTTPERRAGNHEGLVSKVVVVEKGTALPTKNRILKKEVRMVEVGNGIVGMFSDITSEVTVGEGTLAQAYNVRSLYLAWDDLRSGVTVVVRVYPSAAIPASKAQEYTEQLFRTVVGLSTVGGASLLPGQVALAQ